jgi:hypothetical protein
MSATVSPTPFTPSGVVAADEVCANARWVVVPTLIGPSVPRWEAIEIHLPASGAAGLVHRQNSKLIDAGAVRDALGALPRDPLSHNARLVGLLVRGASGATIVELHDVILFRGLETTSHRYAERRMMLGEVIEELAAAGSGAVPSTWLLATPISGSSQKADALVDRRTTHRFARDLTAVAGQGWHWIR